MSMLRTILISCAVAVLPMAAHADAPKAHNALKGHPNLVKAEKELINASNAITKSQDANECVFGLEGGHGADAKKDIDAAYQQVYDAAEFVSTHAKECVKPAAPKK